MVNIWIQLHLKLSPVHLRFPGSHSQFKSAAEHAIMEYNDIIKLNSSDWSNLNEQRKCQECAQVKDKFEFK